MGVSKIQKRARSQLLQNQDLAEKVNRAKRGSDLSSKRRKNSNIQLSSLDSDPDENLIISIC